MEELLNKLIEKGYCPRKIKDANVIVYNGIIKVEYKGTYQMYHIRELVSKESNLWQFVCENKLENPKEWKQRTDLDEDGREYVKYSTKFDEYRLIESALCDENKLEQFLLENIKVE